LMNISLSVNANVANPFDNYDEKKFHEHFKTIKDRRELPA